MNKFEIGGYLLWTPEMERNKNGKNICTIGLLATDDIGEKQTVYINCYNEVAELVSKYKKKGEYISVVGYSYGAEGKMSDGIQLNYMVLIATHVEFISKKTSLVYE